MTVCYLSYIKVKQRLKFLEFAVNFLYYMCIYTPPTHTHTPPSPAVNSNRPNALKNVS